MNAPHSRYPFLLTGLLLCALLMLGSQSRASTAIQDYVTAMQPGTNLGNTLDAFPTETYWGQPYTTEKIIQGIAAQGYKSIRIPVTWKDHVGGAPNYTVDAAWMDRVQQIVDWSLQSGLYVMLNMHHDSMWVADMPASHDVTLAKYKAIWTQIATRFKDHPNKLMFESINEPQFTNANDATSMALLNEINTSFVKLVRGIGGGNTTRPLVLPSLNTNSGQQYLDSLKATMASLNDPNLIATVHYYGWYPFSVNLGGYTRFDETSIQQLKTSFDAPHDTFVANGIPVIVGEFGLLASDHVERGEFLKYDEYVVQYAQAKGITHMVWDCSNVYDRHTLDWFDPVLAAMMKQAWTGRAISSETDLLFLRDGAPLQDAVVNLNLNGNTLASVKEGARLLTPGTDYAVSGDLLTIKSSVLAAYASGPFGERTTLTLTPSVGPDWVIHLRHVSVPTQSSATAAKGSSLSVPTAFNGDVLATIKSNYTDGTKLGPINWTDYQQWGDAFKPDYVGNNIVFDPSFFKGARAGTADFVFHFWSGRILRYQVVVDSSGGVSGQPMPSYDDAYWVSFVAGGGGSWSPPAEASVVSGTYSATGLPAWASIDPVTGVVSGTPGVSGAVLTQATITVSVAGKAVGSMELNLVVAPAGNDLAPVNLSSRGRVGLGDQVMVSGFVVSGSTPRDFLLRGVGPTLGGSRFKVAGTLADPRLLVSNAQGVGILSNDQWGDAANVDLLSAAMMDSGAFSLDAGSRDAAMLASLSPGLYTAQASGVGNTTGVALLEVYDRTVGSSGSSLVNISTRAFVGTGDDVLIAGIVFSGRGTKRVLLRAVGPTLGKFGINGALANPQISLVKDGVTLATNSNWSAGSDVAGIRSDMASVGAFDLPLSSPEGSHDAVLIATLPEGAYTMIVRGVGNTTGVALAEVYVLP
jgi:aryl-phospho-beta-D-glucosidase BglC (GH1 family)